MEYLKAGFNHRTYYCFAIILFAVNSALGQTSSQEQMEKLNFMIGEWIGVSTTYQNDTIAKQVSAAEKISYKLNKNLFTI